eukprot:3751406-Alexandrium_andersonii.AAC.1
MGGAPASAAAGSVEKNSRLRGNADHAAVSMLVTRSSSGRRPRAFEMAARCIDRMEPAFSCTTWTCRSGRSRAHT